MEYTKHHIVPKSRKRKSRAKVLLPDDFHKSWHGLFGNLKPNEAVVFVKKINELMYKRKIITASQIQSLRNNIKEV